MYATLAWFQSRWNWEWDDKSLRYSYKNWHVTEGLVENPKDVYDAPEDDYEIPVETIAASATSKPTPSQTNFNPAVPTHDELKIRGSQLDHNELRHFVA